MHAARRHCAPPTVTAQTCTVVLLKIFVAWRAENKSEHVTSQSRTPGLLPFVSHAVQALTDGKNRARKKEARTCSDSGLLRRPIILRPPKGPSW